MAESQFNLLDKINLAKNNRQPEETLNEKYGETFQTNLLKCFVTDSDFYLKYNQFLTPDLFSKYHSYIFEELNTYYNKYNSLPSKDILDSIIKQDAITSDNKAFISQIVVDVFNFTGKNNNLDYYKETTKDFIRNKRVKEAFIQSLDLAKKGNYSDIIAVMMNAVKEVDLDKSIGMDYFAAADRMKETVDLITIPTPFEPLNVVMKGGLARSELGMVMGGTGAGKSWVLQTIAAHALMKNYNVVYYTLEMSELEVSTRVSSILLHKDSYSINSDDVEKIKRIPIEKGLSSRLFAVEFPAKSCSTLTIKNNLKSLYNYYSFKPDMICVDYADLMQCGTHYSEKRHELSGIYEELKGLARETNTAIWTISQVNRDGYNKRVLTVQSIAEDYGKTTVCDFILAIGRTLEDRIAGIARGFIAKFRRGKDALEFSMHMGFSTGEITMEDELKEVTDANKYKNAKDGGVSDAFMDEMMSMLE